MPNGVFSGLSSLIWLNLSGNNDLTAVSASTFTGLTSLQELYLNDNIALRRARSFETLPALQVINLENTLLDEHGMADRPFAGLSQLRMMNLKFIQFDRIPYEMFLGLESLQIVKFRHPNIPEFDKLKIKVEIERVGGGLRLKMGPGAPFAIEVPIDLTNGSLAGGRTALTIPTGSRTGDTVTVTRDQGSSGAVSARLGTLPGIPADHVGYRLVRGTQSLRILPAISRLELVLAPARVAEADVAATGMVNEASTLVTARLSREAPRDFGVEVRFEPASPATGSDFTASADRVLSFAEGATESTGGVRLVAIDNPADAPDKRVVVSAIMSPEAAAAGVQPADPEVLVIADDDGVPSRPGNLEAASAGGGITLSWDPPAGLLARHEYRYRTGTGGSYPEAWTRIAESGRGQHHAARYTVAGLQSGTTYTFQVRAVNAAGAGGAATSGAVALTESLPEVTIAAAASPVVEGQAAVFGLRRSGAPAEALTVVVAVTEEGSYIKPGTYQAPRRAVFAAASAAAALSVETADDTVAESDGGVTVTVTAAANAPYAVGAAGSATVRVTNNDAPVTPPFMRDGREPARAPRRVRDQQSHGAVQRRPG